MLVHAGTKQELLLVDKAGFTPLQLASDKGHRQIAHFLVRKVIMMLRIADELHAYKMLILKVIDHSTYKELETGD